MMKRVLTYVLIAVFALTSSGCGSGGSVEKKLIIWLVGSEGQAQTVNMLGEIFAEETGTKVLCQAISWGNAHSKYLTSIAGDVTPDIGAMGLTWGMEFGELGALVDLRKEYPGDVMVLEGKIFPGIIRSTRVGEKMFGVPFDLSEHIMYYRTDMIPNPPDTWDELVTVLKDLKSKGKGMVFDWGSLDWIGYSPFLWQAGGDYYNVERTKATLDSAEATRAMDFFAQLYKEGVPKTTVPLEQGMRTGDYPLAIAGNWKIIRLTLGAPEIKGKWSIAMLPKGPSGKRTAFIGGRILGIFSRSKKKDEAWEFIKFLFKPENQIKIYRASLDTEDSYLPPNMDTWNDLPMDVTFKKVLREQAMDAQGPPPVMAWDASTRYVNNAVQMVMLKGVGSAEALEKANGEMQEEMNAERF